jgi:hypothetical protein
LPNYSKAGIAQFRALIHAPAFDSIDPAAHERFVSLGYKPKGLADLSCG